MKKLIPLIATIGALALAGCDNNNGGGASTPSTPSSDTMMNATTNAPAITNGAPAQ